MKKVSILACALAVLLLFTACASLVPQNTQPSVPTTTADTRSPEEILLQAYKDQFGKELNAASLRYFGYYEGIYLATFHVLPWSAAKTEEIGDFSFTTSDWNPLRVYMNGEIFYLKDAYDQKLIDDATLEGLYHFYIEKNPGAYGIIDAMAQAYYDMNEEAYREAGLYPYDFWVQFVGSYDGAYMAFFIDYLEVYTEVLTVEEIGAFRFEYPNSNVLKIYKDGAILPLKDAYEQMWIDDAGLEALYNDYISKYPDHVVE